jgi:hypothetical protein
MNDATQASAQRYAPDSRNDEVEVYVNGAFGNGGAKLGHGSGGIVSLRAE